MIATTSKLQAEFTSGYAGETDYDIRDRSTGRVIAKVVARHWGNLDGAWNTGVWESDIEPAIGSVWYKKSDLWQEFPTPEIMELFPNYVARTMGHTPEGVWRSSYRPEPPKLVEDSTIPNFITFVGRDSK